MASLAAKSTSTMRTSTCSAARRTPRAVRVVAQAQPLRAPEAQQQQQQGAAPRAVQVSASASASLGHHGPAESVWFEDLARFFNLAPQASQEDEEWRQIFGQYLEEDDKAHRSHGMFVSHLAERLALEPPQRR